MLNSIFSEKKCVNCGKIIYPTVHWVYKIVSPKCKGGTKYYCTYSCFRKGKWDEK